MASVAPYPPAYWFLRDRRWSSAAPRRLVRRALNHHALVFVRFAHDRRLVVAVLFLFFVLFVLVLLIRISGRHRVAHDHQGTPVDQPGGKFLGCVWGHVVAPRSLCPVWTDFRVAREMCLGDSV